MSALRSKKGAYQTDVTIRSGRTSSQLVMNKLTIFISLIFLLTLSAFSQDKTLTADEVMQKTIEKLGSLKTVSYDYRAERNYASERFFHELKAASYLDFRSPDKFLGVKFQFVNGPFSATFNGSEVFFLNRSDHTIRLNSKPGRSEFDSSSYLGNSPASLKQILPKVLADKTIPRNVYETRIDNKEFYVIEYVLEKFYMDVFGEFAKTPLTRKLTYRVTVSKDDFMPVGVLQKNGDIDFIKTNFTNINQNPIPRAENTWYYSTYLGEYKFAEPSKNNLVPIGALAQEIDLPSAADDKKVSLSSHRGKVVLVEFWIFHCGACQAAVSPLNALHEKYKKKDFKLLTVNIYDSKELVDLFIETKKPLYPVLYKGEETAKTYGVDRYPTVILLDKNGLVIYSGVFNAAKIDALIEKNL